MWLLKSIFLLAAIGAKKNNRFRDSNVDRWRRPLLKRGLMVFVRVDQHSSTLTTDQMWFLTIFDDFGGFILI